MIAVEASYVLRKDGAVGVRLGAYDPEKGRGDRSTTNLFGFPGRNRLRHRVGGGARFE